MRKALEIGGFMAAAVLIAFGVGWLIGGSRRPAEQAVPVTLPDPAPVPRSDELLVGRFLERDLRLVRPPDLRRFLTAEAERRPALGSQARTVAALKCFFRFLVENEYLERDPAHVLRTPKKREALHRHD